MPVIVREFDAIGWRYTLEHNGEMISVALTLDDEFPTFTSWFLVGGTLMARSQPSGFQPVQPVEDVYRRLNQLNSQLSVTIQVVA